MVPRDQPPEILDIRHKPYSTPAAFTPGRRASRPLLAVISAVDLPWVLWRRKQGQSTHNLWRSGRFLLLSASRPLAGGKARGGGESGQSDRWVEGRFEPRPQNPASAFVPDFCCQDDTNQGRSRASPGATCASCCYQVRGADERDSEPVIGG
jgi:hypothetical protein